MARGGARPNSGPKKDPSTGKALKPYKRREQEKPTADAARATVTSPTPPNRRPLVSDASVMAILSAMREQRSRASSRPRTPEWNPYIIRPNAFGPAAKMAKKAKIAMDDNAALVASNQFAVTAWQAGGLAGSGVSEGLYFLGYPYLSELAQRPEFRLFGEIAAEEMTRKWIEYRGTDDESIKDSKKPKERNRDDEEADRRRAKTGEKPRTDQRNKEIERKMLELKDFAEDLKLRANFKNVAAQDSYFGISHLYLDLKGVDINNIRDPENRSSIGNGRDKISQQKLKRGCLNGVRVIEPVWCYPTAYDASNPLSLDWYDPVVWYVMGTEIHKTRLLPFIGRPIPDILKPAYAFGGLAMTQMAQPYVDIWLRTRESVGEIIHAFSVMVLMTNMGTSTMPGGGVGAGGNGDVVARMMLANMLRDNQGMMIIDKDTEDFKNISAPISGLDSLQAQAQEHLFSVGRIPAVKYAGIQPTGLNATSEGEMRAFNDTIHGQQEHLFRPGLTTVTDIMQISLWGERDPDITFEFMPLHELTEKEKAEVRKIEAETDQIRIDSGVVSQEEVRSKLVADTDSGFHGLDPDDVPDLLGEEMEGLIPPGAGRALEAEIGEPGENGEKEPPREKEPAQDEAMGAEEARGVLRDRLVDAREADRLGYLKGAKRIRIIRDKDKWNGEYDDENDVILLQRKWLQLPPEEQVRVLVHEGGHRAQFLTDADTFGRFVRMNLATEEVFAKIANKVHREDQEEQEGHVHDLVGETFAESYARFCLGMDMPVELKEFWLARTGQKPKRGK